MTNQVRFKASLDDKVSSPLGKIRDQFDRLGKSKGAASILQGVGIGAGISAFNLLGSAAAGAVNLLGDAVKAGMEEEQSIAKLTAALKANVPAWDQRTDAIERVLKSQIDLGFSDDEQRDSLAKLVVATNDVAKAQEYQLAAMDLARLKGIDLATATEAMTRIEGGQFRALKALGIELRKGADSTEALAAVQKAAHGQAEAFAETTGGKLLVAQTKVGEKMDELGGVLLPIVAEGLGVVTGALDILTIATDLATLSTGRYTDTLNPARVDLESMTDATQLQAAAWTTYAQNAYTAAGLVQYAVKKTAADWARESAAMASAMADTSDASDDADDEIKDLGRTVGAAAKRFADLAGNVDDAANALAEAAYGPEELRLAFHANRMELKDNQDELDGVTKKIQNLKEKGKPIPRDLKQEFNRLQSAVNESKQEVIRTGVKLESIGGISMGSLRGQFSKLGINIDGVTDEAAALWRYLQKIASTRITSQFHGTFNDRGQAGGGPYAAGQAFWVGEEGPELRVESAPGYTLSRRDAMEAVSGGPYSMIGSSGFAPAKAATPSASPVVISLQLDGREVARAVDRHLYYAAASAPRSAS